MMMITVQLVREGFLFAGPSLAASQKANDSLVHSRADPCQCTPRGTSDLLTG